MFSNKIFTGLESTIKATLKTIKGEETEPFKTPSNIVNYYISAGQSLSIGHTDLRNNVINTDILEGVYLYEGIPAIAPNSNESITNLDTSSLIAFSQPSRETHIYTMLKNLINVTGGEWIVAPQGRGGKRLIELNKGTEPFNNGVIMKEAAQSAASVLDKEIQLPFFTFIQGESDVSESLDFYESEIKSYYSDMVKVHSDISGKKPPMFITQIGTSGSINFAARELDISNNFESIYCAGPNWPIARLHPSSKTDYTHLNPEGYILLGSMLAKSIEEVVFKNNFNYKPMQPENISVVNDLIIIDFHTPDGDVVVDTDTFPLAPSLGIQYRYGKNTALQADSWSLNGKRLFLQLGGESQPLVIGGVISGGNTLTDHSSTDGISVPLINLRTSKTKIDGWEDWCCQFSIEITKDMGAIDPDVDNIWTYGSPTINTVDSFATILGVSSCYFLDGETYQVDYDSAVISSGTARLWVGDDSHTIVENGSSLVMTRGTTKRLRLQSGNGGFSGKVINLRIKKIN